MDDMASEAGHENGDQRPIYIVLRGDHAAQPSEPQRPAPPMTRYPVQHQASPYYVDPFSPPAHYPPPTHYRAPPPDPRPNQVVPYAAPYSQPSKPPTAISTSAIHVTTDPDCQPRTFKVWSWLNLLFNPMGFFCSLIAFIASYLTESYNESGNQQRAKEKSCMALGCNICALLTFIIVIGGVLGIVFGMPSLLATIGLGSLTGLG